MMDLKDLQYFLAVAQAGTITGAAAKLCMAQPPLSRQMKELEEELGTTLFIRGKRHIRLTEEGIFLRQQAEEILSLMEKTRGQLSRMGTGAGGLISIGVTESCGAGVLSDIIEKFHSDFPGIRYNIWCGNGDEINDKLDKGLVDLGIVREPFRTEKYESALIKTESWTALLSRDHPMAEQPGDTILFPPDRLCRRRYGGGFTGLSGSILFCVPIIPSPVSCLWWSAMWRWRSARRQCGTLQTGRGWYAGA